MVNIVLLFEEAKKGEDHFGLFSISGELSAETSNDPLSTQTTLTLLHMVPGGLTFCLAFQHLSATLTAVGKIIMLSTGPSTQDYTNLDEP